MKLYEIYEDSKSYHLVLDNCKGGEVYEDLILRGKLSEQDAAALMKQLLYSLKYMHETKQLIHRDLKPANIMLESKKDYAQAKLIDFGTALYMKDKDQCKNQFIGTLSYIAPEIFKREGYDKPIDMWACGVICY